MNKLTFIVPIYNSMQFMNYHILSFLNQTNNNFNILYVDDGSMDGSLEFLSKIFKDKNNIKVIHQKNKGPSAARNLGIDNIETEYFTFLDPDDAISNNYVDTILYSLEMHPKVSCYTTACHTDNIYKAMQKHSEYCKRGEIKNKFFIALDMNRLIFQTSIVHNNKIKFDESISHFEGELFCLKYFEYINDLNVLNGVYHIHNHRPQSLTKQNILIRMKESLPILYSYKNKFKRDESNKKILEFVDKTNQWISNINLKAQPQK